MKATQDYLILDSGPFQVKSGAIYIPEGSIKPREFARVVSAGPDSDCKKGDYVGFAVAHQRNIDGFHKKVIWRNKHPYLVMRQGYAQMKFTDRSLGRKLSKQTRENMKLDYEKDVQPLGRNIIIAIDKGKEETDSGIKLPEFKMGGEAIKARVVSLGKDALASFADPQEIQKGDIVLLSKTIPGGYLPYQEVGKEKYWRVVSDRVVCVWRGGKWVPIGGRIMAAAVWPDIEEIPEEEVKVMFNRKVMTDVKRYRKRGTSTLIPQLPSPKCGLIVSMGRGWSESFLDKSGPSVPRDYSDIEIGDLILVPDLISPDGKAKLGDSLEIDGVLHFMFDKAFILAKIGKGDMIDSMKDYKMEMSAPEVRSLIKNL